MKKLFVCASFGALSCGAMGQDVCVESSAELLASDQNAGALFGIHVDVDGSTMVVGASDSSSAVNNGGAVYVFERSGGVWSQTALVEPEDQHPSDFVGYSVSVDGDWLAAGAWGADQIASLAGAVYVFQRDLGGAGNWGQAVKLVAPDGSSNDLFGFDVAVDGSTLVVGAPLDNGAVLDQGSVYVYGYDEGSGGWVLETHLFAPDPVADMQFGTAVAVDGDTLVVGAIGDDDGGTYSGAVYVFERDLGGAGNWGMRTKLAADTGGSNRTNDQLGFEVAIEGDRLVAGAIKRDLAGVFAGAAYVYERDAGGADSFGQVSELLPGDGHSGQWFGSSVGVSGDLVVVGALRTDGAGEESGAAYVFARDAETGVWGEVLKLEDAMGEAGDLFGSSVAIDGLDVAVGARMDVEGKIDGGSVTALRLASGCDEPCPADFTGEGTLDIFDVFAFLDAYGMADSAADFTGDGVFDIFDVFGFLDAYAAGCP